MFLLTLFQCLPNFIGLACTVPFFLRGGGIHPPRLATAEKSPGKVGLNWICQTKKPITNGYSSLTYLFWFKINSGCIPSFQTFTWVEKRMTEVFARYWERGRVVISYQNRGKIGGLLHFKKFWKPPTKFYCPQPFYPPISRRCPLVPTIF